MQQIMALFSNGVGRFRTLFRRHAVIKLRRDGIHFLFLNCLSDRLGSRNYVKQRLVGLIWLVLKKLISAEWKRQPELCLPQGEGSICLTLPGEMNALAALWFPGQLCHV